MLHQMKFGKFFILLGVLAVGCLLLAGQPASAQTPPPSGGTVEDHLCMQRIYMGPTATVTNSNLLNCTANDIRLSRALSVSPTSCFAGSTIDLTATFEVIVTANSRYDAGFFFRVDGGGNARGDGTTAGGECSLSWLTVPAVAGSPALNLDGDTCGDLNSGTYNVTFTIPNVKCVAAAGTNPPVLKLPNCTSWHSNSSTACGAPSSATDPLVYNFHPDTKSKCVCDDNFTVPVTVESFELGVVKSVSPGSLPEPGGQVTYTVQVTNGGSFTSVTIGSIIDDVYGDLGSATNANVTDNTCPDLINTVLTANDSTPCSFKADVSGNSGDSLTDTVEVCGNGSGGQKDICGHDDATVTITDVYTAPTLVKTAQLAANCQMDVTYQVVVSNNSTVDPLTVTSLTDDKFGDITTVHAAGSGFEQVVSTNCAKGGTIAVSSNYTCGFVGRITSSNCTFTHQNTVTAGTTDDDGRTSTPTGKATVTNVAPTLSSP
jgi:hypothetical protein